MKNGGKIDAGRYQVYPTKIEIDTLYADLNLPRDAKIITVIARLHPQKGHTYLIQAAPDIIKAIPQTRILFIGEGELHAQLNLQIEEQNLSAYIQLVGVRQDIPHILSISDLFVLPSLFEGLPNALLEAMASGTPAVATNVDGSPELVVNNETGLIIEPKKPGQLAEAILRILQDSALAKSMGQSAQARVANDFSIEQNIRRYSQLYEGLLTK